MKKETKVVDREIRMATKNFRAVESEEGKMIVEGYAIVFDSPATWFGFTETISRDALKECDMSDVPLKYNHEDSHLILARTRNKSLQLEVDDVGLKIRAELIDTSANVDIYKSIKAGLLDKMSFEFTIPEDGEVWDLNTNTRTITKIDRLWDVSVVDTPFYDSSSIYARALSSLDSEKKKLDNLKEQDEKRKIIEDIKNLLKGGNKNE